MSTTNPTNLKPSKPTKPSPTTTPTSSRSSTPSLSSHLAMIELKHRILTSLSKLSDRDTHQIAIDDLQTIIQTLTPDGVSIFLNSLYEASNDPKPSVKKEVLRLLALLTTSHPDSTSTHLTKIITHIVRKLKDSDSGVKDSCREAIGALSSQYLRGESENGNSIVSLFVKPLFETFGEQNKAVQGGAAMCMAKMVESAKDPPIAAFQKLCPRICKYLNNQNFLAKAALLSVVSCLSQVGAIAPQSFPSIMLSIHGCLENSDWATRKAAADTLSVLASHSRHLVTDGAASTITVLEACRFDKVKPVRDSMTEALQLWKKVGGKGGDGASEDPKAQLHDGKDSELTESVEKSELRKSNPSDRTSDPLMKDASSASSPNSDSNSKVKGSSISDKTVGILKKKAPALSDKELNPDFFQNLDTRGSGELPVEVVVPRRCLHSSHSQSEEELELNDSDSRGGSNQNGIPGRNSYDIHGSASINFHNAEGRAAPFNKVQGLDDNVRDKWMEQRVFRGKDPKPRTFDADDRVENNQRDSGARLGLFRADGQSEGSFANNKGNWLVIQRQLSQLERQQANLTKMLQDFMGGSHDSMVTLENRVRGLERVVEDMARDLALSSGRRGSNLVMGFEGSSGRYLGKYNGLPDYSSSKLGRGGDGRIPFAERYLSSEGIVSGVRGRDLSWRSDVSEAWDSYGYGALRNGHVSSRRATGGVLNDGRIPRIDHDGDQIGNRRAWDKGPGPVRLGEGPSARSVWQASKDEATLEAIRVAGEDNGTSRTATRVAIPEAEALVDDNPGQERGPLWASWTHAMDSLHVGDLDSAYAEVLSTGDDLLLVKLMDRSGPVVDQLSNEIASEVLPAIVQFLLDQSVFDIGLSWIQQLAELVIENGHDFLGIPIEVKRELLWSLHEATTMELPEDWEGATVHQLMLLLASSWGIDLQQLEK
ncbi:ARM repeat superfamily protein [Tasmannia lanceolata]|uniref:ARM repeat superfamily protein n=1 Tax=Tasmannia lanceolata TaxID=3420 RepID=UPI00406490B0